MELTEVRQLAEDAAFLRGKAPEIAPRVGIVLGTGLKSLAAAVDATLEAELATVPGFDRMRGLDGRKLIIGKLGGHEVAVLSERFHLYQGYSALEAAYISYVFNALGVEIMIHANNAGGLNADFEPGDIMVLEDHINLTGTNPLLGPNDPALGERWPNGIGMWDAGLRKTALAEAAKLGLARTTSGVYACVLGPSLETVAEVRMLRTLGADAVGMSTVPEAIAARHAGMANLGLSIIANVSIPLEMTSPHDTEEIVRKGKEAVPLLEKLIINVIGRIT